MTSLTSAHRGYQYQDLLVACSLVDMLLGTVVGERIDEKLTAADRLEVRPPRFSEPSIVIANSFRYR